MTECPFNLTTLTRFESVVSWRLALKSGLQWNCDLTVNLGRIGDVLITILDPHCVSQIS